MNLNFVFMVYSIYIKNNSISSSDYSRFIIIERIKSIKKPQPKGWGFATICKTASAKIAAKFYYSFTYKKPLSLASNKLSPIKYKSTSRAHSLPSEIAQTTKLCPLLISPALNILSTPVL